MSKFKFGDVVKMNGNEEPCVVYRIVDAEERMLSYNVNERVDVLIPHVRIEVMGWVPVSFLTTANHHQNMFALDKILWNTNQTN